LSPHAEAAVVITRSVIQKLDHTILYYLKLQISIPFSTALKLPEFQPNMLFNKRARIKTELGFNLVLVVRTDLFPYTHKP